MDGSNLAKSREEKPRPASRSLATYLTLIGSFGLTDSKAHEKTKAQLRKGGRRVVRMAVGIRKKKIMESVQGWSPCKHVVAPVPHFASPVGATKPSTTKRGRPGWAKKRDRRRATRR